MSHLLLGRLRQRLCALAFIAWLPNLLVAEYMTRRRGLPALYLTTEPALAA
ncbi:hypothetical protein [Nocardia iowensis]|uniref:Uncharacterized protein n=1 Tax=Nocardia iowensis TaxID=204891 RepID=A0ABX8RGK8_NOCIO|nr:hypothetical protein [Nocardia iowensis]QXN88724.1 hypothetical protein KV110_24385 [Nocardia iowensis]